MGRMNPRKRIDAEIEPIINDIVEKRRHIEKLLKSKRIRYEFADLTLEMKPIWLDYDKKLNIKIEELRKKYWKNVR